MGLVEELLVQPIITGILLVIVFLLIVYFLFSDASSQEENKEPPGPKPVPILGNMLQLDLKRPYLTLHEVSVLIVVVTLCICTVSLLFDFQQIVAAIFLILCGLR